MDLGRLRAGEWVAAASGVALLVSLFMPWYAIPGVDLGPGGYATYGPAPEGTLNGWQSLAATDLLLAFAAAGGVLLAVVTGAQPVPAVPIALSAFLVFAGLAGVVLVSVRLVNLPGDAAGREPGLWLALAAVAGIVIGAALAVGDERWSGSAGPETVRMPAPRP
jgi:hypothetical protein